MMIIRALTAKCTPEDPLRLDRLCVEIWRGEVLESTHRAHAALIDARGALLMSAGDPDWITTARSSLKPFQLWPTLLMGGIERFQLSLEDIALMCASHNGEPAHIQRCEALLKKLARTVDELECGSHAPYHQPSSHALIRAGHDPSAIHNNCSGKHCGMLALTQLLNASGSYLDAEHPTQQMIFKSVERLLGRKNTWRWGVDGCSLPTPAISLRAFATLFAYFAAGGSPHAPESSQHLPIIFEAMSTHAGLVAGTERFDTAFMRAASGQAVCKVGGEAIRGFAIRDQTGAALGLVVKVEDGAMRALHPGCLALLERLGLIDRSTLPPDLSLFVKSIGRNWAQRAATETRVQINELSESEATCV